MTTQAITIKRLDRFLEMADDATTHKFIDTEHNRAFFRASFREIEYFIQAPEDTERLLKKYFIECSVREIYNS